MVDEAAYLEEVTGDVSGALDLYQKALQRKGVAPALRRRAQVRAGLCLERLGRDDDALRLYRTLMDTDGGRLGPEFATARRRSVAVEARLREDSRPRPRVVEALDRLIRAEPEERVEAIAALRALSPDVVVPILVERLSDQSPKVRHYAVLLLGQLKDVRALTGLRRRLYDPVTDIRCNAALALWQLGDGGGQPLLRRELGSAVDSIRFLAASHLSHWEDPLAGAVLVDALGSDDVRRRRLALVGLRRLAKGTELGFEPEADATERAAAVARWQEWLKTLQDTDRRP
jgi:HEAT repeat protein